MAPLGRGNNDQKDQGDDQSSEPVEIDNTVKDPDKWKTADDPITGAQRSTLETMGFEGDLDNMTKAEASKAIDEARSGGGS